MGNSSLGRLPARLRWLRSLIFSINRRTTPPAMPASPPELANSALGFGNRVIGALKLRRFISAAIIGGILSVTAVPTASAHEDHSSSQWPTTCIDLNDVVETHLGNHGNVGIYQRTFADQAETACQNDHRNDVRGVFAWAFDDAAQSTQSELPDLAWPTDCVELNDIVENHLGNIGNVRIYQRVFSDQAEPACRNDHREDVRGVFAWAFGGSAPVLPSRLAFLSDRDGDSEIYLINADGTGLVQLTHNSVGDLAAVWSPDSSRLVFGSDRDGDWEVFLMNADGTGIVQLTHNSGQDSSPAWSPDGRRLAFVSDSDGDSEIYLINADGTGLLQLTHDSDGDWDPAWSPDGRRIAFSSNRDGDHEIYLINSDGTDLVQLTHNSRFDISPTWSPDGRRIVFMSDSDGEYEIYIIDPDGSVQVQLTNNARLDILPSWSPDGRRIAFMSDRDGNREIYLINADGTGLTRLTYNPAADQRSVWSPGAGVANTAPPGAPAAPLP